MKIYCILFDALNHSPEIESICKSKGKHYSRQITNSYTTSSLWTMFSGKNSSQTGRHKLGWCTGFTNIKNREYASQVSKSMILNQLPDDWKFHIHGDSANFKFIPNNVCDVKNVTYYTHTNYKDELEYLQRMQALDNKENHFIFIKYNHYHGALVHNHDPSVSKNYMINTLFPAINTDEDNSLFWIFADHGDFKKVGAYMNPPHAWLAWASVIDNIDHKVVKKDLIHIKEFYNTVYNKIYKTDKSDVHTKTNLNKIYIADDGRNAIDGDSHTTVSAIKRIDKNLYLQVVYHMPDKKFKCRLYDSKNNKTSNYTSTDSTIDIIKKYLKRNENCYFN